MTTTTRWQAPQAEAASFARILAAMSAELERAEPAWGVWADAVRQEVEARHGVAYRENDPVVVGDAEYSAALDAGTALDGVRRAFGELLRTARRAGVEYTAGSPGVGDERPGGEV